MLTSSRNEDPACMGENVTFTCSILNGNSLNWFFGNHSLFEYGIDSICGEYMRLPSERIPGPFNGDAEIFSVMARRNGGSAPDFNCSSILWVTTTSRVNGTISCKTALGGTIEASESYSYNVLGKILEPC